MKLSWNTCLKVGITAFLLYLCTQYWPIVGNLITGILGAASPLLIGCVIAYIANILMTWYERHFFPKTGKKLLIQCRRPVCMVLAFVSVIAIVAVVLLLVVPELVSCVSVIISAAVEVIGGLVDFLDEHEILSDSMIATLESIDWRSRIGQLLDALVSGVGSVMDVVISTVTSVFSGVVTGFMSLIFSIYLLLGKDTLSRQFRRLMERYMKPGLREKTDYILSVLNESFHKYIVGQCTEAVILGVLCALGMLILRLPYAVMVGTLIAVTALIPVAGAWIGGAVGALMIFSVSPVQAVIFIVYLLVLQQLENNLVYPKVVGSSLGLPAIWVLAAVTLGGGIMGVAGMLLSVPIASAAYRIIKDDLNRKQSPTIEE